ncbi:MAG: acyltransferase domain-containing protein [Oscillospiraceae bacterium]|nr:acyltransferase domain-containing protein [Oscillospiraceae bacterium]
MLNVECFINYCEKIKMFPEALSEMKELFAFEKIEARYTEFSDLFVSDRNGYYAKEIEFAVELGVDFSTLNMFLFINFASDAKAKFDEKGIDEKVYYDTMLDITISAEVYHHSSGRYGLDDIRLNWLYRHLNVCIFTLGRLQFEISPLTNDIPLYLTPSGAFAPTKTGNREVLTKGAFCLSTHIPEGPKLYHNECIDAYKNAKTFFKKHFNEDILFCTCWSWLISPQLRYWLGEDSNIIKFQRDYTLVNEFPSDGTITFLFLLKRENPDDYPEDTSLRRKVKAFIKSGGILTGGYGVMSLVNL